MSKNKMKNFQALFGGAIHTIVSSKVDAGFRAKPEGEKISEEAKLYTVKTVNVNSLKLAKAAGNVDVVIINGGEDGLTVPCNQEFITKADQGVATSSEGLDGKWFGEYAVCADFCNAMNEAEKNRLERLVRDLQGQIGCLTDVISANNQKREVYNFED
jgi:hypothetical protein